MYLFYDDEIGTLQSSSQDREERVRDTDQTRFRDRLEPTVSVSKRSNGPPCRGTHGAAAYKRDGLDSLDSGCPTNRSSVRDWLWSRKSDRTVGRTHNAWLCCWN